MTGEDLRTVRSALEKIEQAEKLCLQYGNQAWIPEDVVKNISAHLEAVQCQLTELIQSAEKPVSDDLKRVTQNLLNGSMFTRRSEDE